MKILFGAIGIYCIAVWIGGIIILYRKMKKDNGHPS